MDPPNGIVVSADDGVAGVAGRHSGENRFDRFLLKQVGIDKDAMVAKANEAAQSAAGEAAEAAGQWVGEVADAANEAAAEAGDTVEDAAEKAGDAVEKAAEEAS